MIHKYSLLWQGTVRPSNYEGPIHNVRILAYPKRLPHPLLRKTPKSCNSSQCIPCLNLQGLELYFTSVSM